MIVLLSTAQPNRITKPASIVPAVDRPKWWRVDIVIAVGPGHGQFLQECLASVAIQDQSRIASIVVVDDGADLSADAVDTVIPAQAGIQTVIPAQAGIQSLLLRSEARNSHRTRALGVAAGTAPLLLFLDADNKLSPNHLESCCRLFERNPNLGIVYQDFQIFGDCNQFWPQPRNLDPAALARVNCCDTNSMLLREAVEQTGVMRDCPDGYEDWWIARRLVSEGWEAEWQPVPQLYRSHHGQRSIAERVRPWHIQTSTGQETVTIVGTISDRVLRHPELWSRRLEWLAQQDWPRSQIRLLFANTSGTELPRTWFSGLDWHQYAGVSTYRHDLGHSGLESAPRIDRPDNQRRIQTAVAAIFNRAFSECQTEYALTWEDDVFPRCPDLIRRMMADFDGQTAAVAAPYRLRFAPYNYGVWRCPPRTNCPDLIAVSRGDLEELEGCGLGCTMWRLSQIRGHKLRGNTEATEFYDVDLCARLRAAGFRLKCDWQLECDHVGAGS